MKDDDKTNTKKPRAGLDEEILRRVDAIIEEHASPSHRPSRAEVLRAMIRLGLARAELEQCQVELAELDAEIAELTGEPESDAEPRVIH
jgi:hypothetical protein